MNSKEWLLRAIRGEATDMTAVAPVYLGLYLNKRIQSCYVESYARKMASKESCAIDHAEDARFRAEATLHAYHETFAEQPDWIHVLPADSIRWAELGSIPTPYRATYNTLGFQGMILHMHERPDLFFYAMERKHQQL